jgi:hypothetical protein
MRPEARQGKPFIYMTFRSSAALSGIPVILCHRREGARRCRLSDQLFFITPPCRPVPHLMLYHHRPHPWRSS